ncbi:MAG: anaerobic ribonucleoside-triphosphate reductase activating protein [Candidatus Hydrothermarchaeales archaeon]
MKLLTGGFTQLSTVDYPDHVASVLYLCGCPYSCPFCQNFELLDEEDCAEVETDAIIGRMVENLPLVDSICITGGEPLIQLEPLLDLLKKLKENGMSVKLDTNGFYPDRLRRVLEAGLVDYLAMDIKAPLDPEKYGNVASRKDGKKVVENVKESLGVTSRSGVAFEPRTTIVPTLIDDKEDLSAIAKSLKGYGFNFYVLQQFCPDNGCLDKEFEEIEAPKRDHLYRLGLEIKDIIPNIWIRTMENGQEKVGASPCL